MDELRADPVWLHQIGEGLIAPNRLLLHAIAGGFNTERIYRHRLCFRSIRCIARLGGRRVGACRVGAGEREQAKAYEKRHHSTEDKGTIGRHAARGE